MLLRNDIMRFSVLGVRSDIRIELQAPVVLQGTSKKEVKLSLVGLVSLVVSCYATKSGI